MRNLSVGYGSMSNPSAHNRTQKEELLINYPYLCDAETPEYQT